MKDQLSRVIHATLNRLGVDLRLTRNLQAARERERAERQRQPWHLLQNYDVRTVLDIGAKALIIIPPNPSCYTWL